MLQKGVVYKIPYKDCDNSVHGETERNLQKRLVENKTAVQRGDTKNGMAVHACEYQHKVDWKEASVLEKKKSLDTGGEEYWRLLRSGNM